MQQNTPSWIRRGPSTWVVLALATLPLISCYESKTITCSSGLVCPASMTCSADGLSCLTDTCGDGLVQAQELCDDGNTLDGDGCSANCRSRESCGDGVKDLATGEVCDDKNTLPGDGCSQDCKSDEKCGNGIVDKIRDEVCDDGNSRSGDGCSADCLSQEFCGNGYLDAAKGEKCDDGNNEGGDGCSGDCRSEELCGNNYTDTAKGEVCDDGNRVSGDGCSADCKSNETCGNNTTDVAKGEVCDDGDNEDGDGCSANCRSGGGCGNGVEDHDEECDVGSETAHCTKECKISFCGDGYTNLAAGEECDFRNPQDREGCLNICKFNRCGDGVVNEDRGEVCDDRNTSDCGTCDATCTQFYPEPVKASGAIEIAVKESDNDKAGEKIHDGWKFSISDGHNLPRVFEFEKYGGVESGNIPIEISNGTSKAEIAEKIATEIQRRPNELAITATETENPVGVSLELTVAGSSGNQLMIKASEGGDFSFFKIRGMSGGKGRDCPRDTPCMSNDDCAPGLKCKTDPKTCRP